MIILVCKNCGNKDLVPTNVYWEATCSNCCKDLSLWEVQAVQIIFNQQPSATEMPEVTEHILTQMQVKCT